MMAERDREFAAKEHLAAAVISVAAISIVAVLAWILTDIVARGMSQFSLELLGAEPEDAGRSGGIASIMVSTLLILLVTLSVAVPISLATAIALTEQLGQPTRFGRWVRRSLDALAAVPSIVFGLFGHAFFCVVLGLGYSILAGGLTLACMVLPLLIRTFEQALRAVPEECRYAAAALGLSRTTTMLRVVLPAASPALAAGLVLSMGRALAETAALIFTSGYVTRMPQSLLDSGRTLSVHIYDLAMNVPGGNARASATAAVLVAVLLLVNAVAMLLVSKWHLADA